MTQHSCDQCKDNESAEESRYKNKHCPFVPDAIIIPVYNGSTQIDSSGNTVFSTFSKCCSMSDCAAWQICGGTTTKPKYGCRFIERGFEF